MAKLELIQQKYTELLLEQKKMERDHAKLRKRSDQLQKEKDQARSDVNKVTSMKNKLETLCRELQKENKRIKVIFSVALVYLRTLSDFRC